MWRRTGRRVRPSYHGAGAVAGKGGQRTELFRSERIPTWAMSKTSQIRGAGGPIVQIRPGVVPDRSSQDAVAMGDKKQKPAKPGTKPTNK